MLPIKKIYIDSRQKTVDSASDSDFSIDLPTTYLMPDDTGFYVEDVCLPVSLVGAVAITRSVVSEMFSVCVLSRVCVVSVDTSVFALSGLCVVSVVCVALFCLSCCLS